MGQNEKTMRRRKVKLRSRTRGQGTAETPRLCVYRSVSQIYAQLIDDVTGSTMLAVSSMSKDGRDLSGTKTDVSRSVGKLIGEKALEKGITKVIFDRNGFRYHGRVKALADGAREAGLVF